MIAKSGEPLLEKIMLNESAGLDRDRPGGGTNNGARLVFCDCGLL